MKTDKKNSICHFLSAQIEYLIKYQLHLTKYQSIKWDSNPPQAQNYSFSFTLFLFLLLLASALAAYTTDSTAEKLDFSYFFSITSLVSAFTTYAIDNMVEKLDFIFSFSWCCAYYR